MLVPDGVVEGLDLAVMKHNEEEAFEVSVAPEYGFGSREEQRALATVPPNSQLHYAVEVSGGPEGTPHAQGLTFWSLGCACVCLSEGL